MRHVIFIICTVLIASCSSSQRLAQQEMKIYGSAGSPDDSILTTLQKQHDILLVFAEDNPAWTRTTKYNILAEKNKQWKGYKYEVHNATIRSEVRIKSGVSEVIVSQISSDSVLRYVTKHELWKAQGDGGKNFCNNTAPGSASTRPGSNCNITDANTWKLFIIIPDHVKEISFYAPEYFEQCCPGNRERKNFVEAVKKIKALVGEAVAPLLK